MTPMNWPVQELSRALGDQLIHLCNKSLLDAASTKNVQFIQTDSRTASVGDLFVCLKGERFDAHDFAEQVVSAGALGLVVDHVLAVDVPQWVVKDTRIALGLIAKAWRDRFAVKVLGVVGSNGKTTTKEMLASICCAHFGEAVVLMTSGNLNNDIGVPQTLLRLREEHQVAVVEMGMNHPGEIEYLSNIVRPDVILLTNAQREHQEFMKTVLAVAVENAQSFKSLNEDGYAVFPADTPFDDVWVALAGTHRVLRFGGGGDVYAETSEKVLEITLYCQQGNVTLLPAFVGAHNIQNASAAMAAACAAGCSLGAVKHGLEAFRPVWGRMQVCFQSEHLVLINDAYNANPDSVNAAIDVLAAHGGNTLLVLGDMGEVGDDSEAFHREVGSHAKLAGVTSLLAMGAATSNSVSAFGADAIHFDSVDSLVSHVLSMIRNGFWTVLVKGSRFMKMERVVMAVSASVADQPERNDAS